MNSADQRRDDRVTCCQPVNMIVRAATIAPTEPTRSEMTSSMAPRMFRLSSAVPWSTLKLIKLTMSPPHGHSQHRQAGDCVRLHQPRPGLVQDAQADPE